MKIPLIARVLTFGVIPILLLSVIIVQQTSDTQLTFDSPQQEIAFYRDRQENNLACDAALRWAASQPENFSAHAVFLNLYITLPQRQKDLMKPAISGYFGDIIGHYNQLALSPDKEKRQIGRFGSAKFDLFSNSRYDFTGSLQLLDSVPENWPYVNELKSDILYEMRNGLFTEFLEKEIQINPGNQWAVHKIINAYISYGEFGKAGHYLELAVKNKIPVHIWQSRNIAFHTSFSQWIGSMYKPIFSNLNSLGGIVAIVILLVWIVFVFMMDLFKDLPFFWKVTCVILPVITSPLVFFFYDFLEFQLNIRTGDNAVKQIFLIGLFEESIKILPVLLLLQKKRVFSSPYSIFFAANASGIVFAFLENILYFTEYYDLTVISGRSVLSCALHIITVSTVAYGIIEYKFHNRPFYLIPLCFIIAITVHGLYNIMLNEINLLLLVAFLLIIGALSWSSMMNNCLNNSQNYVPKDHSVQKYGSWLISGLSLVLLIEYLVTTKEYGRETGLQELASSLLYSGWLIILLAFALMRIEIVKGKWGFIDFGGVRQISYFGNYENKKIQLQMVSVDSIMPVGTTWTATILKRIKDKNGNNWYIIHSENNIIPYSMICFKDEGDTFYDRNVYMHLRKINEEITDTPITASSYPYLKFVRVSPVEQ